MKNKLKIFLLAICFFNMKNVYAASAWGSISVSTNNTVVGNSGSATLTISSDVPIGQIYGTFSCGNLGSKDLTYSANNNPGKSQSYTISWKANTPGTYTCQVTGLEVGILDGSADGIWPSVGISPKTIKVIGSNSGSSPKPNNKGNGTGGTTSEKKEYSSDNNLSSLSIEGQKLTPEFNKDVTEYKLSLDESIEKIKVDAKTSHEKATLTGTGEISLSQGKNTIEIKVTAENGNEKVYKIIVTVEDQQPINVKVGKNKYTVVKRNNNLIEKLDHYNETTIKLDNQDVIAYKNPTTKVLLVILKDQNNKIGYYIYNQTSKKYEEYHTITIGNITLQLLEPSLVPEPFQQEKLTLQNEKINFYKMDASHKVGLIYGTNVKTGNTSFYVYNPEEETLSKYYNEEVKYYQKELKNMKNYLMIFIGIVAFLGTILIIYSLVQGKKKRKRKY